MIIEVQNSGFKSNIFTRVILTLKLQFTLIGSLYYFLDNLNVINAQSNNDTTGRNVHKFIIPNCVIQFKIKGSRCLEEQCAPFITGWKSHLRRKLWRKSFYLLRGDKLDYFLAPFQTIIKLRGDFVVHPYYHYHDSLFKTIGSDFEFTDLGLIIKVKIDLLKQQSCN